MDQNYDHSLPLPDLSLGHGDPEVDFQAGLQGPDPAQNLENNPAQNFAHNPDQHVQQGGDEDDVIITGQYHPPFSIDEINERRQTINRDFIPMFANPQQAVETYGNWTRSRNQAIAPGSNDRKLDMLSSENQELVRRLFEAFRNIEGTFEGEIEKEAAETEGREPPAAPKFSGAVNKAVNDTCDFDVQVLCSVLLEKIQSSQEGKNELPPTYGEKVYKRYNSFMERFDAVEEVLKKSKLVCKNVVMGQEWLFRVAWNPEAEIRRKAQNKTGNDRRNKQNRVGAEVMTKGLVEQQNGKFGYNKDGEWKELLVDLNQPSAKSLEDFMNAKVPTREGQTDTAAAQRSMGISRKRTRGQPANPPAKRARLSQTPSNARTPAPSPTSTTPAGQTAAAPYPAQQPSPVDPQLLQAPVPQAAPVPAPTVKSSIAPAAAVQAPVAVSSQPNQPRGTFLPIRARSQAVLGAQDSVSNTRTPEQHVSETLRPAVQQMSKRPDMPAPNASAGAEQVEQFRRQAQSENHIPLTALNQQYWPPQQQQSMTQQNYAGGFNPYDPRLGPVDVYGSSINTSFLTPDMNPMFNVSPYGAAPMSGYPARQPQFAPRHDGSAVPMNNSDTWGAPAPNHPNPQVQYPHLPYSNNPAPPNGGGYATGSGSSAAPTPPENDDPESQGIAHDWREFHSSARNRRDDNH